MTVLLSQRPSIAGGHARPYALNISIWSDLNVRSFESSPNNAADEATAEVAASSDISTLEVMDYWGWLVCNTTERGVNAWGEWHVMHVDRQPTGYNLRTSRKASENFGVESHGGGG